MISLTHRNKHRKLGKIQRQSHVFQIREQDKTSEKELNGSEISNLLNKEFNIMLIKMLTELRRRMDEDKEIKK